MTVEFKASFARDLKGIKDQWVLRQVLQVIQETECAQSLLRDTQSQETPGGRPQLPDQAW